MSWPLDAGSAGKYRVHVRLTSLSNRNATATWTVTSGGGATNIVTNRQVANQQYEGGKRVPPGLFDLAPGPGHKVVPADTSAGPTIATPSAARGIRRL